ncbi:hypothetical protein ACTJJ4_11505 [Microbacterium sp. 22195]|uniref:hypothetical protein n=1 Tax=Microbacterium sp. 22195 TaxID=3453891 RepID=UPI003F838CD5
MADVKLPRLDANDKLPEKYMPQSVADVATALGNAKTIDDALMSSIIADGTSATAAQLSATIADGVSTQIPIALNDDPTIRQALVDGVSDAVADLNIGREVGVETTGFYTPTAQQVGSLAFEGSKQEAARFYDSGHVVWAVEERADLTAGPDVAAVFAYRDDGAIVSKVLTDGQVVPGDSAQTATTFGVAWGDSTTEGTDLPSPLTQRWTVLLASLTGQTVTNRGQSGARSDEITWYLGAVTSTGTPTGGNIPASGTVNIIGLDIDPWRADSYRTVPVIAIADNGTVVPGTLGRNGSGDRVFTRTTPGSAITTGRVQFRSVDVPTSRVLFLGMGVNDEPLLGSGRTVDDIKAWYQDVATNATGHLVVWGMLDRGPAEGAGTVIGDAIRELEAWARITFGDAWCPLRQYLASPQALTDALIFQPGFVPTGADTTAQAAGTVPPSFRASSTSVHLNVLGHQLQARYFHRRMILRGLI